MRYECCNPSRLQYAGSGRKLQSSQVYVDPQSKQKVKRGLDLRDAEQPDADLCVDALLAGLDEWRVLLVRRRRHAWQLRVTRLATVLVAFFALGSAATEVVTGTGNLALFLLVIGWAISFAAVLGSSLPAVLELSQRGHGADVAPAVPPISLYAEPREIGVERAEAARATVAETLVSSKRKRAQEESGGNG